MKPEEKIVDGMKKFSHDIRKMTIRVEKEFKKDKDFLTKNIFVKPLQLAKIFEAPEKTESKTLDDDEREFLASVISEHSEFVLSHLEPDELRMLIGAMERFEVSAGHRIIVQGDVGDYLYVLREGTLKFLVDGTEVDTAGPGEVVGEVALLYDCPRSATVIADTECTLYRVSQETFRRTQASFVLSNDDAVRRLLRKAKIFDGLPDDMIREMSTFVFQKKFQKDDMVLNKGDDIDALYFLKSGRLISADIETNTEYDYKFADIEIHPGDSFGVRGIALDQPSPSNVKCLTDVVVYALTKERFLKCMQGMDIHDIVRRSMDVAVIFAVPIFANADLSLIELYELGKRMKRVTLQPGEYLSKIGENVDPALYFMETHCADTGYIELTENDKPSVKVGPSMPFGFGKHAAVMANLEEEDSKAASEYAKAHNLVKLKTKEEIDAARRNIKENRQVVSQYTIRAMGTAPVQLRKLNSHDVKDVIHDLMRLGKDYSKKRPGDARITHESLEKKCLLGQGTFGQVWLCRDPSKDLPYALKVQYKRELIDQHQARGVIRETNIMQKMHHPFVMGIVNAQQDSKCLYMAMKLIQGGELRQQMRNADRPNLSEKDTKFYAACILEGLSYMHRREYIYRDLKGENVLLDKDGYCVIIDLGFAKRVPDKTFTFCGTPIFIAPEIILNKGHDRMADIWSFGVMIYEMLFGTNPFMDYDDPNITQRVLFKRIVRAQFQRPRKSSALDAYEITTENAKDLIKKLLVVNPQRRLGSSTQLADFEIRNHPWFEDMDWGMLYRKELDAPWVPTIKDPFDGGNFNVPRVRDKSGMKKLTKEEQRQFESFC